MCWINLVAKVAYAIVWAPSFQGPRSPWVSTFSCWRPFFFFSFFFFACRFFCPRGGCRIYQTGAPLQALAPGRWRPSLRHWEHENVFPVIGLYVHSITLSYMAMGAWYNGCTVDWSRLLPSMVFGHEDNSYNREAILHHYTIDLINDIIVGFLL